MINEVISAVCMALHVKYPRIPIYKEEVETGLVTPCITVTCDTPDNLKMLSRKRQITCNFVIQYFTGESINKKWDLMTKTEELYETLEVLPIVIDATHTVYIDGINRTCVCANGVLTFSVTYKVDRHLVNNSVMMGEIDIRKEFK